MEPSGLSSRRIIKGADIPRLILWLLLAASACWHLFAVAQQFQAPIDAHHSFRKAQTAITAFYTLQDGPRVAYETPILGKPWSIPMEFPLYQWLTAGVSAALNLDLVVSGRLLSLLFFYLCLPAVWLLLKECAAPREARLVACFMLLVSPLYLYWSRTVMIESTALCAGLWFLACGVRLLRAPTLPWGALAVGLTCGVAAGLVKITTFCAACVPLGVFWLTALPEAIRGGKRERPRVLLVVLLVLAPLAVAWAWVAYADALKARNPLADFLLSGNLRQWNFGPTSLRWDADYWRFLWEMTGHSLGTSWAALLLLVGVLAKGWTLRALCALLAGALGGPLVFANLFYMHDYYHYAVQVYLIMALAVALGVVMASRGRLTGLAACILAAAVPVMQAWTYCQGYGRFIATPANVPAVCEVVRKSVDKNKVLMLYDQDWSSYLPYYAQRRALMNRENMPLNHPRMRAALNNIGVRNIGAVYMERPRDAVIRALGLRPQAFFPGLYLPAQDIAGALQRLFGVQVGADYAERPLFAVEHEGELRLVMRPPAEVALPLPDDARRFHAAFGVHPQWKGEVAVFRVLLDSQAGSRRELLKRYIKAGTAQSQEVQRIDIPLPPGARGRLLLRTEQETPARDAIPAFWSSFSFE